MTRAAGDEAVLFFDLDNYIGTVNSRKGEKADEEIAAAEEAIRAESEDTRGIFFAADDDEEPQEIEDTEEMERRLQELAEIERRTFGTLVFEHSGDIRLPAIDDDGEWDVMAEPRILGKDHRVDDAVVESLHDELLEALIGESHKDGNVYLLSSILMDNVPERYSLSPKACQGILRRAAKRGKELPEVLKRALERQALLREGR